jgi:hypothetical protein
MLSQKVKEIWNIPRKIYWLLMNGKHESLVTSWPQVSSIQIKIKGLAGYDPLAIVEEDSQEEAIPAPSREKFKKGWIKLGIAGIFCKVHTSLTIEQVAEKYDFSPGFEYWLPNGRRVDREEKLRTMFPPGLGEVHIIDEVIEGDTKENLKEFGPVILKIEGLSITVLNNQTFEEAFKKSGIHMKTDFIILPSDERIDAREDRIRQHLACELDEEIEIRWDGVGLEASRRIIRPIIHLEDGCIDYATQAKMIDLDEDTVFASERDYIADITIRTTPGQKVDLDSLEPGARKSIKEMAQDLEQIQAEVKEDKD